MLQILGIAAAKCSFSTVSGVKAANTRLRVSERLYGQFSKCSGTECAAFASWPMKCKTAVKHLLNTGETAKKKKNLSRRLYGQFSNAVVRNVRHLNRGR